MATTNRRLVLASRPSGEPAPQNFRLEEVPLPSLADGEVLVPHHYLSLDPCMRARMREGPGVEAVSGGRAQRLRAPESPSLGVARSRGTAAHPDVGGVGITGILAPQF